MADTDKTYVGIRPCGCVTFLMIAGYASKTEARKELREQIKDGNRIEITTLDEARGRLAQCPHGRGRIPSGDELKREIEELIEAAA